jgi:hypothetical protein
MGRRPAGSKSENPAFGRRIRPNLVGVLADTILAGPRQQLPRQVSRPDERFWFGRQPFGLWTYGCPMELRFAMVFDAALRIPKGEPGLISGRIKEGSANPRKRAKITAGRRILKLFGICVV